MNEAADLPAQADRIAQGLGYAQLFTGNAISIVAKTLLGQYPGCDPDEAYRVAVEAVMREQVRRSLGG